MEWIVYAATLFIVVCWRSMVQKWHEQEMVWWKLSIDSKDEYIKNLKGQIDLLQKGAKNDTN